MNLGLNAQLTEAVGAGIAAGRVEGGGNSLSWQDSAGPACSAGLGLQSQALSSPAGRWQHWPAGLKQAASSCVGAGHSVKQCARLVDWDRECCLNVSGAVLTHQPDSSRGSYNRLVTAVLQQRRPQQPRVQALCSRTPGADSSPAKQLCCKPE
jgi:hypothetical protein